MTIRLIQQKLSNDYVKLVFAVIAFVFILSSFFIFTVYNKNKEALYSSVEQRALHLDSSLSESFNYIIYLIDFLSKQISSNGSDLDYIKSLYSGFQNDLKIKDLSSWSMFDWLTPDRNIRVTSVHGILNEPVSLAERANLNAADKDPDRAYFNEPSLGKISKQLIIPIAKAVNNKEGQRLGFINIGVTIESVLTHLERYNDDIEYTVFTDQFFQLDTKLKKPIGSDLVESLKLQVLEEKGFLDKPVISNDIKYIYYYKSSKYPFILLLGYNKNLQNYKLLNNLVLPIVIFLVLGFIAITLSYILYIRVIRPIFDLGKAAQEIAEERDVNISINNKLPSEIVNLATQLNNINTYKKQLLQAKKAVEDANNAKTEFLSSTAHELRSPLNAMIGMAEMIKKKVLGVNIDKYIEYASDIEQSGHELLEFITDLMDINKAETGSFDLEKEEWIDIDNVISRSIKININKANESHIQIHKYIENDLMLLYADSRRLRQILINLISNSIKYSPNDTVINISAVVRDGKIYLIVADQGYGMSKEEVVIAMTKWGTIGNKNIPKGDSYGLGLPLAHHLATSHGAEFLIDSMPGNGTTITIVFPKERVKILMSSIHENGIQ